MSITKDPKFRELFEKAMNSYADYRSIRSKKLTRSLSKFLFKKRYMARVDLVVRNTKELFDYMDKYEDK